MMRAAYVALAVCLLALPLARAAGRGPICTDPEAWPAGMAYGHLKNAGALTPESTDFSKTRAELVASEKIGRDRYRQVHVVRFTTKAGAQVSAVVINEASHEECSLTEAQVFMVAQEFERSWKAPRITP
jgi:hypothetical protein